MTKPIHLVALYHKDDPTMTPVLLREHTREESAHSYVEFMNSQHNWIRARYYGLLSEQNTVPTGLIGFHRPN
jgi:hypothetical protein